MIVRCEKKFRITAFVHILIRCLFCINLISMSQKSVAQNMKTSDDFFGITGDLSIFQSLDSVRHKILIDHKGTNNYKEFMPFKVTYRLTQTGNTTICFNVSSVKKVSSILVYSNVADSLELLFKEKYGAPHSKTSLTAGNVRVGGSAKGWIIDKIGVMFSTNSSDRTLIIFYDATAPKDFLIDFR